ncbi:MULTISPECIES: DUF4124 domain-containing protein [Psychrobacter]|uniref:Uncharacterized protein DUF4124 n=1 Tax=Psychrobacter fozii TaxID=198480 RepID=A0A2V4UD75_9GAMM|nr:MULTISPECIES: DUF4124 domain-containing protein [Psychrobacter]MBH0065986.1 DUF4124 domain-containing protein [Psychrobacter sp. SZ93C1]MBH0086588.1 DUF4124 domain-containing protein [Psychrobacter sp. SCQQ22]PYE38173.1 uncharacterized protein DUF4124 [Psychrobacter fozii]
MAYASKINTAAKLLVSMSTACMLMLSMNASHAIQVYKSVGAHGEVKYSQHSPQNGKNIELIEFRSDGRQNNAGNLAGKTDANQSNAPSAEEQRVAALETRIKEQEAQANAQRCQSLRSNLTNLNVGGRIYEMDASGKRQYLDGREIELKRERVQQAIDQYCGNPTT